MIPGIQHVLFQWNIYHRVGCIVLIQSQNLNTTLKKTDFADTPPIRGKFPVPGSSDWLLRRFPSLRWTRKRPEMSFFERIVPVGNVLWNEHTRDTIGNSLGLLLENVFEAEILALGLVTPNTLYQMKSNNVTAVRSVHCSFIQRGCRGCFPSGIRGRCPKTMPPSPSPSVGTTAKTSIYEKESVARRRRRKFQFF